MPNGAEYRMNTPRIKDTPSNNSPHSVTKFVTGNKLGDPNHLNSSGKVFAEFKYPAADHAGFKTLVIPAQKNNHPKLTRRRNSETF